MCMYDAKKDFKYSAFKFIVYVKYKFRIFLDHKFSTCGCHLVRGRCIWSVVGWLVFGVGWSFGRWSVAGGRLVNDFKKIHRYNGVT